MALQIPDGIRRILDKFAKSASGGVKILAEIGDVIELMQFIRETIKKDPPSILKPRQELDVDVLAAVKRLEDSEYPNGGISNLRRRHSDRQNMVFRSCGSQERYGINEESDFMEALGKIVARFQDNPVVVDAVFGWLDGIQSDEEFDAVIEMLLNDRGEKLYREFKRRLGTIFGTLDRGFDNVGQGLQRRADKLRAEREARIQGGQDPRRRW